MSVAFTREEDAEAAAADLPDRPVSAHPNLVTPRGLVLLDEALAAARAAWSAARGAGDVARDRTAMARATRELRYCISRRASAQLTPLPADLTRARFGAVVEIERGDGRRQSFRIVGEDEADPGAGSVSYRAPLARAVLGREVGDTSQVMGEEIEIIAISASGTTG